MALTAPGPPPVAQMLPDVKKRKNRLGVRRPRPHRALSVLPELHGGILVRLHHAWFPSVRLQDLNWDAFYFAPLTSTLSVCPELWALSRASRLASSLREPWRVPYDECVLIAPFDEHSHALDDHRLGVLYREAVGELIAEAFPAPDGCQVITGISECILGAKLLAPWGARPECQAPLHD